MTTRRRRAIAKLNRALVTISVALFAAPIAAVPLEAACTEEMNGGEWLGQGP
jgi:hypothetical protein